MLCSISEGAEAGWCRAVQAGPRVTATIAVQSQVEPSPGGWTPEMGAGREGAIKPVYWFDSFLTIDFNKYRMFILKAFFEFCILFYFNRTCLRTLISINSLLQNQNLALHYSNSYTILTKDVLSFLCFSIVYWYCISDRKTKVEARFSRVNQQLSSLLQITFYFHWI